MPNPPNTISDKAYASLQRRASNGQQGSIFDPKAVAVRKQSEAQRAKASQS